MSVDDLKLKFRDLAKERELTMIDALLGTYLLYGYPDAHKFLAALICCELPDLMTLKRLAPSLRCKNL